MPAEDLIRELKGRGYAVQDALVIANGSQFVIVDPYPVELGQHAGKKIAIAFAMPGDYPFTPPGGIHVKPHLIPVGTRNVNPSPLGSEWQYWSRPIRDWRKERSASRLLSHVNRLMLDA